MKKSTITRSLVAALSAAALSATLVGCASDEPQDPNALDITIARSFDVAGLDPGFLTENAQVVDNIFDTLVTRDEDEALVPSLAESWEQVEDTVWEFTLRDDVEFTNGEPFNAEAVKYSIDRVLDPENQAPTLSYISTVDAVNVVDEYTVQVVTADPDPLIPTRFSRYPTEIVPPAYTEEVGQEQFAQEPIGTGPYVFESWEKGASVTLTRNDDYWGDTPSVARVTFRVYPEVATSVSALERGEVDLVAGVGPDQLDTIEDSENAYLSTAPRAGNIVYFGLNADHEALSDVRVRQALNYAVDVDSIVDNVLGGAAVATNSIIGPADFGYAGEPEGYDYDPARAKELLAEAGYADGFTIELDTVNWYQKNTDVAQAVAQFLSEVGVTATINDVESSVYRQTVPAGEQAPMYMLGWSSTNTLDADASIYAILHTGESYSTYSNPDVDALLDEARYATADTPREELYAQIQETYIADAPRIFMYQENQYYGVSNDLQWEGRIDTALDVASIEAAAAE